MYSGRGKGLVVGCRGGVSGSSSKLYLIVICSINTVVGDALCATVRSTQDTIFILVPNRSTAT